MPRARVGDTCHKGGGFKRDPYAPCVWAIRLTPIGL